MVVRFALHCKYYHTQQNNAWYASGACVFVAKQNLIDKRSGFVLMTSEVGGRGNFN